MVCDVVIYEWALLKVSSIYEKSHENFTFSVQSLMNSLAKKKKTLSSFSGASAPIRERLWMMIQKDFNFRAN